CLCQNTTLFRLIHTFRPLIRNICIFDPVNLKICKIFLSLLFNRPSLLFIMQEKKLLRAGIIGSGFAAKFHFEALQRVFSAKVELVGVHSSTKANMEKFAMQTNIRPFTNLDDLIRECDVLHACTPPVTHEPIIIKVLEQNKDVIVEKPLTGYFGDGSDEFNGNTFAKEVGLEHTLAS